MASYNDYVESSGTIRGRSGPLSNERTPQAEVEQNMDINPYAVAGRMAVGEKKGPDQTLGTLTDAQILNIISCEPVFTIKNGAARGKKSAKFLGEDTRKVFTTFNGIYLKNARTQTEFESNFKFLGFSKIGYSFTSKNQPRNGISVRVSGSGTTWNNGNTKFYPGDLISWRLRRIHPEERRKDDSRLPHIKGIPSHKYTAIMERFDYKTITDFPQRALHWVLKPENMSKSDIYLLEKDQETHLTPEQEFGIAKKQADMSKIFNAVVTLAQYGVITINTPDNNNPLEKSNYNKYDPILNTVLGVINQKGVKLKEDTRKKEDDEENYRVVDGVTEVVKGTYLELGDGDNMNSKAVKFEWLAYKLGLLPRDGYRKHLKPHESFIQTILSRVNAGLIIDPDDREYFQINKAFGRNARKRSRNGRTYDVTTIAGLLTRVQMDSSKRELYNYEYASESAHDRLVGTALNSSSRGEYLDYKI